jgi:hypothetical protein
MTRRVIEHPKYPRMRQLGLDNHQGYSPSHNLMYSFSFCQRSIHYVTLCAITGCCLWLYIVTETRKIQLQENGGGWKN